MKSRVLALSCIVAIVLLSFCQAVFARPAAKPAAKPVGKPAAKGAAASRAAPLPDAMAQEDYLTQVKERIMRYWTPAKADAAQVVLKFRIHKDGHVSWVQVETKSTSDAANQSAEDAITYAGKFPPLPAGFPAEIDVSVDFNSDYNPSVGVGYSRPGRTTLEQASLFYSIGITKEHQGKTDEAIEELNKALNLTPHDGRVRDALVKLYLKKASELKGAEALEPAHKVLLLDTRNTKARERLQELYTQIGKADDIDSHIAMAREYILNDKVDDALAEYGEAWLKEQRPSLLVEINSACRLKSTRAQFDKWESALKVHKRSEVKTAFEQARLAYEPLRDEFKKYVNETKSGNATPATDELGRYVNKVKLSDEFPWAENASLILGAKITPLRKVEPRVATLIDFYADWCGPCRMLSPQVEQIAVEFKGKLKVMKVNIDANKDLARRYGVNGIPHLVLIRTDNKQFESIGYIDMDRLRAFVRDGLAAQ